MIYLSYYYYFMPYIVNYIPFILPGQLEDLEDGGGH